MSWRAALRPGMRAYLIPLLAGVALAASAFMPWVVVGEASLAGFPDVPESYALWVVGLGVTAAVLAALSLITRKNSRHPILLVGLAALAITFLSWQILPPTIERRALTRSQAVSIVDNTPLPPMPHAAPGAGLMLGIGASCVLVGFGLTIVLKRAAKPYVAAETDDDV